VSYQIIIEKDAEQDIDAATAWLAQYEPAKAVAWHFDVMEAIDSLQTFPLRCPLAPESETYGRAIRHLIFKNYRILYLVVRQTVYVLRVRHSRQDTLTPNN
jgi:toxin ParE1/3/4